MNLTPIMQQYQALRQRHADCLLLFRVGDFYELFYEDAEKAARVLHIKLTSRDKVVPMAGIPHHALDVYLRKLLDAGLRVAICEQLEEPGPGKKLVHRDVVRIVTPGTVTEEALLDPLRPNHLVALYLHRDGCGVAWVELTLGRFLATDCDRAGWLEQVVRLEPAECLCPESVADELLVPLRQLCPRMALTRRPDWHFSTHTAQDVLCQHFQVQTLAGFGFRDGSPCLRAAGALVQYVRDTLKSDLPHVHRLVPWQAEDILVLDETTRRSLELVRTAREGKREGSLWWALDRTVTPLGARRLLEWLVAPLRDLTRIGERLDAVEELLVQRTCRQRVRDLLRRAHDLARLTARASTGRISPRECVAIADTLALVPALRSELAGARSALLGRLCQALDPCAELVRTIRSALVDQPPAYWRDGGIIRDGYDAALDELRQLARGARAWLAEYQAREAARTGIPSLKVGYHRVFGYYLEVSHTHAARVPADYERRQTLKNVERFTTPDLRHYEDQIVRAQERATALELELFQTLRTHCQQLAPQLMTTAQALADLDVLAGLAELAESRHYTRPELTEEPVLDLEEARHPVLEQTLPPGVFVPNDLHLGGAHGSLLILTGPNMAGKSTYIRQVALLHIMAQMGSFVPARRARIGLADRIFTRIGASDDIARGQSTFMVEMTEAANILNNASAQSLVILDEIGRGTSTFDGLALAWAIAEYLHERIGCRALFATHYHQLTKLAEALPGVRNANVAVREHAGDIVFLHRVVPGPSDKSYGVHVARLAGLPVAVVQRAQQVLQALSRNESDALASAEASRAPRPRTRPPRPHPTLF